jgi:hypothetical protein
MKNRLTYALALITLYVMVGCANDTTLNETLLNTYSQYVVLRMTPGDSVTSVRRLDSLLKARGYTRDAFFGELRTMASDPDRMRKFYDSVRVRVSRMDSASAR